MPRKASIGLANYPSPVIRRGHNPRVFAATLANSGNSVTMRQVDDTNQDQLPALV